MMYSLPTSITINGNSFPIREGGDYRFILQIIALFNEAISRNQYTGETDIDTEKLYTAIVLFFDGFEDLTDIARNFNDLGEVLTGIYRFINCGKDESNAAHSKLKLIDWETDEQLIVSAVNNVIKGEVRALPYLHWWSFVSYYMAIGECSLAHIVSIRKKKATGKKLEKYEKDFVNENPEYFTNGANTFNEQQFKAAVAAVWSNSGKSKKKVGE